MLDARLLIFSFKFVSWANNLKMYRQNKFPISCFFQISAEKSITLGRVVICKNNVAKPLDSFNEFRRFILSSWENFSSWNLKNDKNFSRAKFYILWGTHLVDILSYLPVKEIWRKSTVWVSFEWINHNMRNNRICYVAACREKLCFSPIMDFLLGCNRTQP